MTLPHELGTTISRIHITKPATILNEQCAWWLALLQVFDLRVPWTFFTFSTPLMNSNGKPLLKDCEPRAALLFNSFAQPVVYDTWDLHFGISLRIHWPTAIFWAQLSYFPASALLFSPQLCAAQQRAAAATSGDNHDLQPVRLYMLVDILPPANSVVTHTERSKGSQQSNIRPSRWDARTPCHFKPHPPLYQSFLQQILARDSHVDNLGTQQLSLEYSSISSAVCCAMFGCSIHRLWLLEPNFLVQATHRINLVCLWTKIPTAVWLMVSGLVHRRVFAVSGWRCALC